MTWRCWWRIWSRHMVQPEEVETISLGSYIGRGHCVRCGKHVEQQMPSHVAAAILGMTEGELADRSFGYCEQDGKWVPALYKLTR